jgi:5-formyltetrahydrofolate cyclo-ligase
LELEKREVRYKFLAIRNKIDPSLAATYSAGIFIEIEKLSLYRKAKTVMFYLSSGSEVVTDFMINSALGNGKTVVVPAIENSRDRKMYAVKISRLEDACQSVYGIRQPEINPRDIIEKDDVDLVFVPGIAFDIRGYRTGYGKGYYDRWLESVPFEKTIGVAYDFQITDKLPIGEYDIPVGIIITEKKIIQIRKN